jgi:hypothetical protein
MRKLYKVIGNVTTAKGLMVRAYRDAKVEGTLVLEADAESFNDPVGKKFMVSGELIQVVDRKGKVWWGYHEEDFREPTEDEL